MNCREATRGYERWMRRSTPVVEADLRSKHRQMRENPFLFLRGTFYRWLELWSEVASDLSGAPTVLALGDLHVESFGTWRDAEGRLAWGVDDFDEAYPLPYVNDLVRLAASVRLAKDAGGVTISLHEACDAILEGYMQTLRQGEDGCPIVLAEREQHLERLGFECLEFPGDFWTKLTGRPPVRSGVPRDAEQALSAALPRGATRQRVVRRHAGVGSLGQPRYVAIATWDGGYVAREAKALIPPASLWLAGRSAQGQPYYERLLRSARRAHDPCQYIDGRWLIRRLSPDANPIDLDDLPAERDETVLLTAMGTEAANVHLGSTRRIPAIARDLRRRKPQWLRRAAKAMAKATERDWRDYIGRH